LQQQYTNTHHAFGHKLSNSDHELRDKISQRATGY